MDYRARGPGMRTEEMLYSEFQKPKNLGAMRGAFTGIKPRIPCAPDLNWFENGTTGGNQPEKEFEKSNSNYFNGF